MHLLFERSRSRFKSNCNILALAWMPYYDEAKFRHALFEYHQRQLINLSQSINSNHSHNNNINNLSQANSNSTESVRAHNAAARVLRAVVNGSQHQANSGGSPANQNNLNSRQFLNTRVAELYQRHVYLKDVRPKVTDKTLTEASGIRLSEELDSRYGRLAEFGWLVVGNVGKIVGVTLTSTVEPPEEKPEVEGQQPSDDLMVFVEPILNTGGRTGSASEFERIRPDKKSLRSNYNLRGHLDEVILVKWNELYQKLATVDSKGNVLIWCKLHDKFTIQTPFYNRAKSVADFKWSNDGKTALICYTDSFILVGSCSGQRHWHSMLNLEDYHITCASWTPNDEQLLLGVSNGNVVIIDLPRSELTELVVNQAINIRAMCWSSTEISLRNINKLSRENLPSKSSSNNDSSRPSNRRNSTVVNHRRLSRDCSLFSRYRYGSQAQSEANRSTTDGDESNQDPDTFSKNQTYFKGSKQHNVLAIDFANGTIKLYNESLDDPEPITIQVNQESYIMQWSSDGKVLASAGFNIHTTAPSVGCLRCRYINTMKFYNQQGQLIHQETLRYTRYPITAFTWAHDDTRLFVATGPKLHCARVFFGVPPLALLAASCFQRHTRLPDKSDVMESVQHKLRNKSVLDWQSFNCPLNIMRESTNKSAQGITCELDNRNSSVFHNSNVYKYQLPLKLQSKIDNLFAPTIRRPYDEHWSLNDIIWQVPKNNQRFYCTLVCYAYDRDISSSGYQYRVDPLDRHSDARAGDHYKIFVLYVEFQGSLVPILRARRVGFLKPEFVIFDPEDNQLLTQRQRKVSDVSQQSSFNEYSQRRADHQHLVNITQNLANSPLLYYDEPVNDNCSDLHLYSGEPRGSGSSLGKQSISDAEHYYNFESDTANQRNQEKIANLMGGRSHHQEPIAIPMTSSPYLLYSMALPLSNYMQGRNVNSSTATPIHKKRTKERHKLRGLSSILTESTELVRIKSNIWGTKFKMINASNRMIKYRSILGSVIYKASILHLQPRQIFLTIKDMSNYCCLCSKHHHNRLITAKKPHSISSVQDNKICMLDMPNPVSSPAWRDSGSCCTTAGSSHSKSKSKGTDRQSSSGGDKVVLPVGDSLKISDVNQRLRYAQMLQASGTQSAQNSSFKRSKRHPAATINSREDKVLSERKSRKPVEAQSGKSTILQPSPFNLLPSDGFGSSGRLTSDHESHRLAEPKVGNENPQEDILTLSLGQGDQVRVEMSSIKHLDDTASNPKPSTSREDSTMHDFLSSNKTLKSIQTITKMIVDLSSKAIDDSGSEEKHSAETSPSKVVELNNGLASSCDYVPPATPVHRPRQVHHLSKEEFRKAPTQSQSATTTPLKFLNKTSSSRQRRQLLKRDARAIDLMCPTQPVPAQQPPPNVPLGRRLSSSAKRLIDGSLRSLYAGTSYSASDVEPEESEPLVSERSRKKEFFLKTLGQSQPCTPAKKSLIRGLPKQSSDLSSLRSQLLQRLRGEKFTPDDVPRGKACSSSGSRYTASSSQLDKIAGKRHGSNQRAPSRTLLKSDLQSSGSDSELFSDSSFDQDNNQGGDDNEEEDSSSSSERAGLTKMNTKQRSKFNWSNSVKDLRDFDLNKANPLSGAAERRGRKGERRRRLKRKSICQNAGCCCSKEFKLKNRPPVWNEISQIYQLDFGGRVTQESAKNLQIDFAGNLALQFGRIDRCTYTLDYKYPFNAVQAMAVALASLTQRLK